MHDIVEKVDRAKAIITPAMNPAGDTRSADQMEAEGAELIMLAIDAIGELLANSRRIAVALERIAESRPE